MRNLGVPVIGIAVLVVAALVAGAAIGGGLTALSASATPTASAMPSSSAQPSDEMPSSDVDGQDIATLPRYPGSVRSEFSVRDDGSLRTTAVEYLVRASIDDVRAYYQGVIIDFGWQRADVAFSGGEWTYVLVDGGVEAVVEIEQIGDIVEIDLLLGQPIQTPTNAPTPKPTPTARPPAPPPSDDDDDDDDSDDDDSFDDSGADDDSDDD